MSMQMFNILSNSKIRPSIDDDDEDDENDENFEELDDKNYSIVKVMSYFTNSLLWFEGILTSNRSSKEAEIASLFSKIVTNAETIQRDDRKKLLYSFVILGHFDELKRKLDKRDSKAVIVANEKVIEYYDVHNHSNSRVDRHKKYYLEHIEKYVCRRDASGATIFHLAYLNKQYKIAQYLVARYPQWAYLPYHYSKLSKQYDKQNNRIGELKTLLAPKSNTDFKEKIKELSLYTGENILHIIIVHRNFHEVRWLLNFYRDHIHSFPDGLPSLLSSRAIGAFFQQKVYSKGVSFGSTTLQFAVSSNDREIFKLVYSFCSVANETMIPPTANNDDKNNNNNNNNFVGLKNTKGRKNDHDTASMTSVGKNNSISDFGPATIFKTDENGNNVLHLCVLHSLPEMYQCVYDTATSYIGRELRKIYCLNEKTEVDKPMTKGLELLKLDETNCFTKKTKDLCMPSKEMLEQWIIEEARKFIYCKFVLALNKDLHSPLTLAASIIDKNNDNIEKLQQKVTMLEFLIKNLQHVNWNYGPINLSTIDLTGIDINYPLLVNYEIDLITYKDDEGDERTFGNKLDVMINYYLKHKNVIDAKKSLDAVKLKEWSQLIIDKIYRMEPALQWLCQNDCDTAVVIPSIQEIIQKKWRLMGFPYFQLSFFLHTFLTIMITLILIFSNAQPTFQSLYITEIIVDILYSIIVAIFFILFCQEISNFLFFESWSKLRGVAKYDKLFRLIKIFSFTAYCMFRINNYNTGEILQRYSVHGATVYYNPLDDTGLKVTMSICVISSWLHLYYFLMAFDTTGPFVLSIARIISKDIPYFLQFYMIVVIAFGCALSMIGNDGNNEAYHGFLILIKTMWNLLQKLVAADFTNDVIDVNSSFPSKVIWIADILLTSYNFTVTIILLNLLIALISITFSVYSSIDQSILLIEKYNIMEAMETTMGSVELNQNRLKYSEIREFQKLNLEIVPLNIDGGYVPYYIKNFFFPPSEYLHKFNFQIHSENVLWWSEENVKQDIKDGYELSNRTLQNTLFIIDPQIDFHEGGTLPVSGAYADSERVAKLINDYGNHIQEIYISLDSHYPTHIAHAVSWRYKDLDANNLPKRPEPYTTITHQDILDGIWIYNNGDALSKEWVEKYTATLEFKGHFKLQIWPEHCIIGSKGHSIVPKINEALQRWALQSARPINYILKGQNLRTEMYSALSAEVEDPVDERTAMNDDLLTKLNSSDRLIVCGQALSHCVNYTVRDLIDNWSTSEHSKIVLLTDGTSIVTGFDDLAENFLGLCKEKGVKLMKTTDVFQGYPRNTTDDKMKNPIQDDSERDSKNDSLLNNVKYDVFFKDIDKVEEGNKNEKQKKLQEIESQLNKLFVDMSSIMSMVRQELTS